MDRRGRFVHDHAPGQPEPHDCPQRDGAVEAVPRRPAVRQPGLRRLLPLASPGRPLHTGGAVRVRGHLGTARPRLRPPRRSARGLPEQLSCDDLDALSRYDDLQSIRLNALGAYALGLTETYSPIAGDAEEARVL